MGRLRTVSLILILGAWGGATEGAAPDDAAAAPSTATRQAPPAPPIKYLEAGAKLFNSQRFELASKYLEAANRYRDQLQDDERTMLDAYLAELARVQGTPFAAAAMAPKRPSDAAVVPTAAAPVAAAAPVSVAAPPAAVAAPAAPVAANPAAMPTSPAEIKQRGRWLLHEGREQLLRGNYDLAQQKVDEARALDIRWGLFDDTPDKLEAEVLKVRPRPLSAAAAANSVEPHDRRTAKAKLQEARILLNNRQYEQAEAVALEVKRWGLSYSLFEDNPEKVAAAARALRRREKVRNLPARQQDGQVLYEELVQTSRQLLKAGRLDEADKKARQALMMDVYPGLNSDRAENVLHDIEMARANTRLQAPAAPAAPVVTDAPSTGLALAQPEPAGAAAAGMPLAAAPATPASDPAVQRIGATTEGGPDLAAPADNSATNAPADNSATNAPAVQPPQSPAPVAGEPESQAAAQPAPGNRGEQLMAEAKALYASGNYRAARETAGQAKAAKAGVDAQADELIAQIGMAEQGGALALYDEALEAIRKGNTQRARDLLTEVAAAGDSLDEGLRTKVQGLLERLSNRGGGKPGTASTVDAAQDAETLAAQKLNAEVGTKIAEARRYHDIDPDKALRIYQQTMQAVQGSGLPPELTRPMVRRLEVAVELAKKDKAIYLVKMTDKKQREEIELKRLRILEADGAKKARVKDLMERAMECYAQGKYVECETYAKKAMEIDPNELSASMLAFKARMERRFKTDLQIRDAKEEGFTASIQGVDRASIPADNELDEKSIQFAKSFKDLTRDRLNLMRRLEEKKDPKVLAIEAELKKPVTLNVDKQPLSDAVKFLQDYTGLNIVVDPRGLADEGLTQGSPVSLNVSNIKVSSALNLMLKPLGLTYKIENEVVLITSPQANPTDTYVKTYYVGDLLIPASKSPSDVMPRSPMNVETTESTARVVGPGFVMGGPSAGPSMNQPGSGTTVTYGDRRMVDMTPLVQLIATSIAPGTWQVHDGQGGDLTQSYGLGGAFGGDAGGDIPQRPIGAITPFFLSISLIIRHTAEVHDQVADLLRQLRRLQDLQVSIEVRFITVQDNFFEQIGVDFDFQIQSDSVGKHSTFAALNPSQSLFPVPGVTGGLITGTSTSTSSSTSTSTSGTTGGTSGGTSGGTTGGTTGGTSGGGTTGGGTTGGGTTGGGTTGGGTTGGGTAGGSASTVSTPVYIVNPARDHTYPGNAPVIVGTQGGGIANFSPNLDIPFTNTTASLIAPTFVNNYQPNAGATFGIAFLSDLEVYLFLTAAQGDTRSNVLSAPKVTTFNGAAATIVSGTLQYYVSSIQPIIGPGAVAYTPNVSAINSGVMLLVTPVVSADRRYVRMTLTPTFNTVNGFSTYSAQTGAVGGSGLGGGAATITGQIQLPNTTTNFITTTVTVPDGGTVLMGGVKTLTEQRIEYGVPVLSKTPLIDRLFRNVGIGRNSQSLMIMVSPHIIILEEEEERLGIPSVQL